MKKDLVIIFVLILAFSWSNILSAQTDKGFPVENYKRNILKWNMTPFLLWSMKNVNLSYERVINPNRSASINAGFFVLPILGTFDSLNIESDVKRSGFTVSGDYRFYIMKRNKNTAPDGLYWGPFVSYHYNQFENAITVINNPTIEGQLILSGNYNIFSAGVEMGYQFVIKEKLIIDLVFLGPSLSIYSGGLRLDGEVSSENYDDYLNAIKDILMNKIPIFSEFIDDREFNDKGVSTNIGIGFRYLLQIGYRF